MRPAITADSSNARWLLSSTAVAGSGLAALDCSPVPVWLRLCTQHFDGGQPDAGCLTSQLRTSGRLADGGEGRGTVQNGRNLPKPRCCPKGYLVSAGEDHTTKKARAGL